MSWYTHINGSTVFSKCSYRGVVTHHFRSWLELFSSQRVGIYQNNYAHPNLHVIEIHQIFHTLPSCQESSFPSPPGQGMEEGVNPWFGEYMEQIRMDPILHTNIFIKWQLKTWQLKRGPVLQLITEEKKIVTEYEL